MTIVYNIIYILLLQSYYDHYTCYTYDHFQLRYTINTQFIKETAITKNFKSSCVKGFSSVTRVTA